MRIKVNLKETKNLLGKPEIILTMKLEESTDDTIATYNTGSKIFEKLKATFLAEGGGENDDGSVWLRK